MTQAKRLPIVVPMSEYTDPDEYREMMPLWSASKPNEYIFIKEKPNHDCVKCGKNFWREPTKVKVATPPNAFGKCVPLSIWIAESDCFICNETHRWLIDPDKPVSQSLDKTAFKGVTEDISIDDQSLFLAGEHITPATESPYSEWQKQFGETDYQAYIRWLKEQQRRRSEQGDIDPNDAS